MAPLPALHLQMPETPASAELALCTLAGTLAVALQEAARLHRDGAAWLDQAEKTATTALKAQARPGQPPEAAAYSLALLRDVFDMARPAGEG